MESEGKKERRKEEKNATWIMQNIYLNYLTLSETLLIQVGVIVSFQWGDVLNWRRLDEQNHSPISQQQHA